jgi:Tfp pilus assembly protein PilF
VKSPPRPRDGAPPRALPALLRRLALAVAVLLAAAPAACDRPTRGRADAAAPAAAEAPDEPSPTFRNVAAGVDYVGDAACAGCHAQEAAAYQKHGMSASFHRWTPAVRLEPPLDAGIAHPRSGMRYAVVEDSGALWQVEFLAGPDGRRLHELRRRIDYVMGSGRLARSYFTEENGRLFQLPLTWYRSHGWDFSPGYEVNNARFERLLPDRCVACHASYPRALPRLEGKYAELRPGIGCERCHGPGALHVRERRTSPAGGRAAVAAGGRAASDTAGADTAAFDRSIVNPARLPLERRLDVCEQCHVHTAVTVPRAGRGAFDYQPSQPLRDQFAFFRETGSVDVVSQAERLRQSACFVATRRRDRPLECATCHDPHRPPAGAAARNQPCAGCHAPAALLARVGRRARAAHDPGADCVRCHMPSVKPHTLPHGTFTDHRIQVPGREAPRGASGGDSPVARYVAAYYARDRTGPEAAVYQGMGAVVYASLANSAPALRAGAGVLETALRDAPAVGAGARPDARMLLGVTYQQLGRAGDAVQALERAAAADSTNPEALRALAQAYLQAGRPAADAARLYERALAVQPALAWMRAEYADLLESAGLADRAAAEYRRALAEQPSLAGAWFNLGALLAGRGRTGDATDALGRAVRLDPALGQALAPPRLAMSAQTRAPQNNGATAAGRAVVMMTADGRSG